MKEERLKVRMMPSGPRPLSPPAPFSARIRPQNESPPVPLVVTASAVVVSDFSLNLQHAEQALALLGLLCNTPDESSSE